MKASHPTRKIIDEIESRLQLLKDKPKLFCWGVDDPVFTTDTFMAGFLEHFPDAIVHELGGDRVPVVQTELFRDPATVDMVGRQKEDDGRNEKDRQHSVSSAKTWVGKGEPGVLDQVPTIYRNHCPGYMPGAL